MLFYFISKMMNFKRLKRLYGRSSISKSAMIDALNELVITFHQRNLSLKENYVLEMSFESSFEK